MVCLFLLVFSSALVVGCRFVPLNKRVLVVLYNMFKGFGSYISGLLLVFAERPCDL